MLLSCLTEPDWVWMQQAYQKLKACSCGMQIVLTRFAKSEDPLMEGHLLLEQYQAQYVAALRCRLQLRSLQVTLTQSKPGRVDMQRHPLLVSPSVIP